MASYSNDLETLETYRFGFLRHIQVLAGNMFF